MQKKNKMRPVISGCLSFFLIISIFMTGICAELLLSVASNVSLQRSTKKSDYIQKAYAELNQKVENIFGEKSMLISAEDLFPKQDAIYAFSVYETSIYKGNGQSAVDEDNEAAIAETEKVITDYLVKNDVNITEQLRSDIRKNAESIVDLYERYVMPEYLSKFHSLGKELESRLFLCGAIFLIAAVLLCFLLLRQYRRKYKALSFICLSFFVAAFWNLLAVIQFTDWLNLKKLGIASGAYRGFLKQYMDGIVLTATIGIFIYCLCGVFLLCIRRKMMQSTEGRD